MMRKRKRPKRNICKWCGAKCVNKFCPENCSSKYRTKQKHDEITTNNGIGNYTQLTLKNYMVATHGHACSLCKRDVWEYDGNIIPIPLIMDHINGRSSDNRLDNLRLVCGNCDMLLPTYKSKNKNSDRTKRKGTW